MDTPCVYVYMEVSRDTIFAYFVMTSLSMKSPYLYCYFISVFYKKDTREPQKYDSENPFHVDICEYCIADKIGGRGILMHLLQCDLSKRKVW